MSGPVESPCIEAPESVVDAIVRRVQPVDPSCDMTVDLTRILAVAAADRVAQDAPEPLGEEALVEACVGAIEDVAAEVVRALVVARRKPCPKKT